MWILWLNPSKRFLPSPWKVKESESEVTQLYPTLCHPMDCNPPGSSIHGSLQARVLEWVAIFLSRESSWPRDRTWVSRIVGRRFTNWATREVPHTLTAAKSLVWSTKPLWSGLSTHLAHPLPLSTRLHCSRHTSLFLVQWTHQVSLHLQAFL